MRRLSLVCTAIAVLCQVLSASPKSDSIVAFTGSRTKVVWLRYAWCNADYTPRSEAAVEAEGASVMLYDTDEGSERVLGTGVTTTKQENYGNQGQVRISRSGRWATVAEVGRTFIYDLTGTNSANNRVFLSKSNCTYWCVKAWGRDAATGVEYAYALNNFDQSYGAYNGTAIYKIPVKQDGTADLGAAVQIPVNGSPKVDGSLSVSADMKKIGGEFPWPDNPGILDAASGAIAARKNMAACHTNIAADNSYRFFHLNDDHNGIYMWDQNLSATNWYITLGGAKMVNNYDGEFWAPRWSNDVQFIASTVPAYPISDQWESGEYWGYSAATVKAKPLGTVQYCVLQKFTADLKGIDKSMAIVADIRNWEYEPDVWMASGYTGGAIVAVDPQGSTRRPTTMSVAPSANGIRINNIPKNATVRVMDARGRVVALQSATGAASIDIRDLDHGMCLVSMISNKGSESRRVTIVR